MWNCSGTPRIQGPGQAYSFPTSIGPEVTLQLQQMRRKNITVPTPTTEPSSF